VSQKRFPSGILTTCMLPWDERGRLLEEVFRQQVRLLLRHTPLLYVMGTAGEGYALSEPQYQDVVRLFVSEMKAGGAEPMVGVISMSVTDVHRRIELAQAQGVKRFQISLPGWEACTEREIFTFFDEVCGNHPDCVFLHYNLMRSRVLVTPPQYVRISGKHGNLVATKNTTDSITTISALVASTPDLQHFLADWAFPFGCLVGECGMLISAASSNWHTARRYYDRCVARDLPAAMDLQADLVKIVAELRALMEPHAHIDGAFDKMFARLHQPDFPLRLLPPYLCAPQEVFEKYRASLKQNYPRWHPDAAPV